MPNVSFVSQKVSDYLVSNGWNWVKIEALLPTHIVQEISVICASTTSPTPDKYVWAPNASGDFSVKSAYDIIEHNEDTQGWKWKFIWKINAHPRILHFLWTLGHGKILTNYQRVRRHITNDPSCNICSYHCEDLNHTFRHCDNAMTVWNNLASRPPNLLSGPNNFFDWIYSHLNSKAKSFRHLPWSSVFAAALWFIWKNRCGRSIDSSWKANLNPVESVLSFLRYWNLTKEIDKRSSTYNYLDSSSWTAPPQGFVKLNVDGSRDRLTGLITAGGAIRNAKADWLNGFMLKIGIGSVLEAELWGVFRGILLARDNGFRKVWIEPDCYLGEAFDVLNQKRLRTH